MTRIGAYELKTHVSAILRRAQEGESFVLTHHGKPVAQLGPIEPGPDDYEAKKAEVWKVLRGTAGEARISRDEIRDLINEGRKY